MGQSRITTWSEITTFIGTESLAVDDGLNKKLLADKMIVPIATSGVPNLTAFTSGNVTSPIVQGSTIAGGTQNLMESNHALAFGKSARSNGISGSLTHTARQIVSAGDCNSIQFQMGIRSTNAAQQTLIVSSGETVSIGDSTAWCGEAYVVAVDEATGAVSAWKLPFACKRVAGVASLLHGGHVDAVNLIDEIIVDGPVTPEVYMNPAGTFAIRATGVVGKNIKWSARVQLSEVRY